MKTHVLKNLRTFTLASLALLAGGAAHAVPVSYGWSLTVDKGNASFNIATGQKVTGTFTYDLTGALASGTQNGLQKYTTSAMKMTANVPGYATPMVLTTSVGNDLATLGDELLFSFANTPIGALNIAFIDSTHTVFNSTQLPGMIDFAKFSSATMTVGSGTSALSGTITKFSAQASDVPEPGTVALFGLALAGLAFVRRRG